MGNVPLHIIHLEQDDPKSGQFSKSRKHAVWLPSFLENHSPDTLRYFLSINMPEGHDTDFRWEEYVDKVNNELIGTYGNFVHRVMTLSHRLESINNDNPLSQFYNLEDMVLQTFDFLRHILVINYL